MLVYLRHKEHGEHIVYNEQDLEDHKKIGWEPFDPDAERKAAAKKAPEKAAEKTPDAPEHNWLGDPPAEKSNPKRSRKDS